VDEGQTGALRSQNWNAVPGGAHPLTHDTLEYMPERGSTPQQTCVCGQSEALAHATTVPVHVEPGAWHVYVVGGPASGLPTQQISPPAQRGG
jgi:hypothetical protein